MPDDKSCCLPEPIFLQSLVLWGMLLLGHVAVLGNLCDWVRSICSKETQVSGRWGIGLQWWWLRWRVDKNLKDIGQKFEVNFFRFQISNGKQFCNVFIACCRSFVKGDGKCNELSRDNAYMWTWFKHLFYPLWNYWWSLPSDWFSLVQFIPKSYQSFCSTSFS